MFDKISSFSERIKQYRTDHNMTLAEMEVLTQVPAQTLNRYELNQRVPKYDTAIEIAEKLNLNPLWLLGYEVETVKPISCNMIDACYKYDAYIIVEKFLRLDDRDKGIIEGRIDAMLEQEKYSKKEVS